MAYTLSARSQIILRDVHPDLKAVVEKAIKITTVDFAVIEGIRGVERQRKLVQAGASRTMNSRHLTGHAVDLAAWVDGEIRWDWPLYYKIADAMMLAASELKIPIIWGGHWPKFPDGPHFELNRETYP